MRPQLSTTRRPSSVRITGLSAYVMFRHGHRATSVEYPGFFTISSTPGSPSENAGATDAEPSAAVNDDTDAAPFFCRVISAPSMRWSFTTALSTLTETGSAARTVATRTLERGMWPQVSRAVPWRRGASFRALGKSRGAQDTAHVVRTPRWQTSTAGGAPSTRPGLGQTQLQQRSALVILAS